MADLLGGMLEGRLPGRLANMLHGWLADKTRNLLATVRWSSFKMAWCILRIRGRIRAGWVRVRSGRCSCVDLDISDGVSFYMVRTQTVAGGREKDYAICQSMDTACLQ